MKYVKMVYFCLIQDFKKMQCNRVTFGHKNMTIFREIKADIDNKMFILVVYNVGFPWMILRDLQLGEIYTEVVYFDLFSR